MRILVTGAAGFIGSALCRKLLDEGHHVVGIDSYNTHYDPNIKQARVGAIKAVYPNFQVHSLDLLLENLTDTIFQEVQPEIVYHFAAQPSDRHSIENPRSSVVTNVMGFFNVLENVRKYKCGHFVFASSSSVYGANSSLPQNVEARTDHPISLYAATKKSNEVMAYTYSHLYQIPTTALRLFTVYGPWDRPDTAASIFMQKVLKNEGVPLYNRGLHLRDFIYIDDVTEVLIRIGLVTPSSLTEPIENPKRTPSSSPEPSVPYRTVNIGSSKPITIMHFLTAIERVLGKKALVESKGPHPGEVLQAGAEITQLKTSFQFVPEVPLEEGLTRFKDWYLQYYK